MGKESKLSVFLWQILAIVPLTNKYLTELACPDSTEEDSAYYYLVTVANLEPVQKLKYSAIYI